MLLQLCKDNAKVIMQCEKDVDALGLRGIRALAVAMTNDKSQWIMLGMSHSFVYLFIVYLDVLAYRMYIYTAILYARSVNLFRSSET